MTKYTDITADILKEIEAKQDSQIEIHISKLDTYEQNPANNYEETDDNGYGYERKPKPNTRKKLIDIFSTLSKNNNLKKLVFTVDESAMWEIEIEAIDSIIDFLKQKHEEVKINITL